MSIETVKICHPKREWVIINKSDFDPKKHTLYGVKKEEPTKKAGKPAAK